MASGVGGQQANDDRLAKIWAQAQADGESLTEQVCRRGLHATWFVDSEDRHACPWCEVDRLTEQLVQARRLAVTVRNFLAADFAAHEVDGLVKHKIYDDLGTFVEGKDSDA